MQNDVLLGNSTVAEGQVSVVKGAFGFSAPAEEDPFAGPSCGEGIPATDTRR